MYPGIHALESPDKPAHIMAESGEVVSYRELNDRSNRLAQLLYQSGLREGDHVAIFMENHPRYPEIYWAALRSGLYLTCVNRFLTADEAAYLIGDCGANALITSHELRDVALEMLPSILDCNIRLMVDGTTDGYQSYEEAVSRQPAEPLLREPLGATMYYSSGTTGRPKGIKRPLSGELIGEAVPAGTHLNQLFGLSDGSILLSPAPLYHAMPLEFSMGIQASGGTLVIMEKFDPNEALCCIETYRCTDGLWVPTMFTRMLKLPDEERTRYDLSSLKGAIHAAAPCPISVKEQMIQWWGPILLEYYAASEFNGFTFIDSAQWLTHKGSVGKPLMGIIHICDDAGQELPEGKIGSIYFELPEMNFEYHNDAEQTKSAQHPRHPNWTNVGDIGWVDRDGYLYLSDRKAFMIISGGENIYPTEIENVLINHPKVLDVAVFGVPHEDLGEQVKAVVQLVQGVASSPQLERELMEFSCEHLARYKCPRSIDFEVELPRQPTGKLYKRILRDRYWGRNNSRIV